MRPLQAPGWLPTPKRFFISINQLREHPQGYWLPPETRTDVEETRMKTRINRLWLSLALAAGSASFPLTSLTRAHDLPSRLASDSGSQSALIHLLDDCLDVASYGDESSSDWDCASAYTPSSSRAEQNDSLGCSLDVEGDMARNGLSNFTQELACWSDHWSRLSDLAGVTVREKLANSQVLSAGLIAARPEEGVPPAPACRPEDTCGFEREYLSVQAAADILQAEVERAVEPALEQVELATTGSAIEEIQPTEAVISATPIPQQFARGIDDEYLAYDLPAGDAHWLGGLGKSWQLRASIRQSARQIQATEEPSPIEQPTLEKAASREDSQAVSQALDWLRDAECFAASVAFDLWPMLGVGRGLGDWLSGSIHFSSQHMLAFGHYLDRPAPVAVSQAELIIVYTDAAGDSLAVPQAFAQAWNGSDVPLPNEGFAEPSSDQLVTEGPSPSDQAPAAPGTARATQWLDVAAWRQWLLSQAASRLDAVGAFCMQSAREIANLAQPQVANRGSADIR